MTESRLIKKPKICYIKNFVPDQVSTNLLQLSDMKTKPKSSFNWLDEHLLLILSGFLIIFIPLYPKIPLAELIPGYIVRMRLEDVFVLLAAIVWGVQVLRSKVKYRSITHSLIAIYLVISLLSLVSAITITPAIPLQPLHLGKSFLHWLRYLEYFILFAITFSAIKSIKDAKLLVKVMMLTLLGVIIYGYGQKYHYWPVFSTMNREFSKGIRLYLTEHARVQSTFGGHYDLDGYLVVLLNLVLALAITSVKKLTKIGLHLLHLLGLWLLILTASRVSFAAYYLGIIFTLATLALSKYQSSAQQISKKTKKANRQSNRQATAKQFSWWVLQSGLYSLVVLVMMLSFGDDMRDRLFHVTKDYPQIEETYGKVEDFVDEAPDKIIAFLKMEKKDRQPSGDWVAINLEDQSVEPEIDPVLDKTDERPTNQRPDDVYVDVPDKVRVATQSASGETSYITVERDRTWSENAMKYGLSMAIRLDTLWPNAVRGFKRNPLLGTGFATLNKEGFYHFTEAESTDNNFLRTLGETGLLGFVSFYAIILVNGLLALKLVKSQIIKKNSLQNTDKAFVIALGAGYIGASIGLLVNALYIDVYASSKVAFTYWTVSGILVSLCYQDYAWSMIKQSRPVKLQQELSAKVSKLKKKKGSE